MAYRKLSKTVLIAILSVFLTGGSPDEHGRLYTNNQVPNIGVYSEIKMSPEVVASVTAAIRAAGYDCPLAKIAFPKGDGAYGRLTKVYCGPLNQAGVYAKAAFRVAIHPNNSVKVKPW